MLLIDDGVSTTQNPYVLEQYDGEEYLFVTFKSYDYCHGGNPTVLVLKMSTTTATLPRNFRERTTLIFHLC